MIKKKISILIAVILSLTILITGCAPTSNSTQSTSEEPSDTMEVADQSQSGTAQEAPAEETAVADGETKTIKWLHHYSEDSTRQWIEMVTELYTQQTGVEFDIQAVSYDEYQTLLKAKIASEDAPDLFDLTASDLIMYQQNGYVEDLTDAAFWDNLIPEAKTGTVLDGKNYFMPLEANASAAYYNVEVFQNAGIEEMPETYDEFIDVLKKLEANGVIPIAFGAQESWTITNDYRADMLQQVLKADPAWMTKKETRESTFADDQIFIDTLARFKERHEYGNEEQFGTDWNTATQMVATGQAAMVINGSWSIGAIKEKNPDVQISCFPVPGTDNPADTGLTTWSGDGFVVYSGSTVKQEVIDFMQVLTGTESGILWQNEAKRLSLIKGLPAAEDPGLAEISRYMNEGKIYDVSSMQNEFTGEYYDGNVDVLTRFLLGEIATPEEAAAELDAKFDEIKAKQ